MPDMGTRSYKKGLARLTTFYQELLLIEQDSQLTAMEIRHIEHSEECVDAVSDSFFSAEFPSSLL